VAILTLIEVFRLAPLIRMDEVREMRRLPAP